MKLSQRKKLEIANICYAYIVSDFAAMTNPNNRGDRFTWSRWRDRMLRQCNSWLYLNTNNLDDLGNLAFYQYAKECTTEICNNILEQAGIETNDSNLQGEIK